MAGAASTAGAETSIPGRVKLVWICYYPGKVSMAGVASTAGTATSFYFLKSFVVIGRQKVLMQKLKISFNLNL